jgi:hypothetical protein
VAALAYLRGASRDGDVVTGLLYVEDEPLDPARRPEHRGRAAQTRFPTPSSFPGAAALAAFNAKLA